MRTYKYFYVLLLLFVASACVDGTQKGTIRMSSQTTTTARVADSANSYDPYVSLDKVKTFRYCDTDAGYCARFPYTVDPAPTEPQLLKFVGTGTIFNGMILMRVVHDGQQLFCELSDLAHCKDEVNTTAEMYTVRQLKDGTKGKTLDELVTCFDPSDDPGIEHRELAGQPAVRGFCRYPDGRDGTLEFVLVELHGEVYEFAATASSGSPSMADQFFDDVKPIN